MPKVNLDKNESLRPLLRWAGSKRLALSHLQCYWRGDAVRYLEPFCGSASLFFRVRPKNAILSDLNTELIAFYKDCAKNPLKIWKTASSITRDKETYYLIREEYNNSKQSYRKSALFYYLNRNCFNGIYRTSHAGKFNVPFSGDRTPKFPSLEDFTHSCSLLDCVTLLNGDFEAVLHKYVNLGDFVFLDPPYATDSKRTFAEYQRNSFSVPDIERVISMMKMINGRGAHFVCTYDESQKQSFNEIEQWFVGSFEVHRNVGGFQKSRRKAKEIIISNMS